MGEVVVGVDTLLRGDVKGALRDVPHGKIRVGKESDGRGLGIRSTGADGYNRDLQAPEHPRLP